jgi:AcrR family transcriptional regulator
MRVAGASSEAIAQSLGVTRRTVYLWFSDPLVKEQIEVRTRDVAGLIAEKLAENALAGLDLLRQFAEEQVEAPVTPALKLAAIRDLLDRHPVTSGEITMSSPDELKLEQMRRQFAELSDEDLMAYARQLVSQHDAPRALPITTD